MSNQTEKRKIWRKTGNNSSDKVQVLIETSADQVKIDDVDENFESSNVEGALKELATKTSDVVRSVNHNEPDNTGNVTLDIPNKTTVSNWGFIDQETDPVFAASAASGIKTTDINNWNSKQAAITEDAKLPYSLISGAPGIPNYTISKDGDKYKLLKDGQQEGVTIDIPKDLVVQSGRVETISGKTYIVLVLNDAEETEIKIEADKLIDVYTGDNTTITISDDRVISVKSNVFQPAGDYASTQEVSDLDNKKQDVITLGTPGQVVTVNADGTGFECQDAQGGSGKNDIELGAVGATAPSAKLRVGGIFYERQ